MLFYRILNSEKSVLAVGLFFFLCLFVSNLNPIGKHSYPTANKFLASQYSRKYSSLLCGGSSCVLWALPVPAPILTSFSCWWLWQNNIVTKCRKTIWIDLKLFWNSVDLLLGDDQFLSLQHRVHFNRAANWMFSLYLSVSFLGDLFFSFLFCLGGFWLVASFGFRFFCWVLFGRVFFLNEIEKSYVS